MLPNGKPQERLRFRDLRSMFQKRIALSSCDLEASFKVPSGQGLRSGPLRQKNASFCVCVLMPTKDSWKPGKVRIPV